MCGRYINISYKAKVIINVDIMNKINLNISPDNFSKCHFEAMRTSFCLIKLIASDKPDITRT